MNKCYSALIIKKESENYGKVVLEIVGSNCLDVKERAEKLVKENPCYAGCEIQVDETTDKYMDKEEEIQND